MADEPPAAAGKKRLSLQWRQSLRWFAAEFLVVVTGVLVALGIGSWWEARRDRALEQSYLTRLATDLAADSAEFARHLDTERARGTKARLLLAALDGERVSDPAAVIRAIEEVGWATGYLLSPFTFQELQATGHLRLIRNPDVRDALSAYYYMALNNAVQFYEYSRDRAWDYVRQTAHVLPPETRMQIALEQPIEATTASAEIARLGAVPNVRKLLGEVLVSTAHLDYNNQYMQKALAEALTRVRAELRK